MFAGSIRSLKRELDNDLNTADSLTHKNQSRLINGFSFREFISSLRLAQGIHMPGYLNAQFHSVKHKKGKEYQPLANTKLQFV